MIRLHTYSEWREAMPNMPEGETIMMMVQYVIARIRLMVGGA